MFKPISRSLQTFNYLFLITSLLLGVIFYDYIQKSTGFSYIDEILALALFTYYIKKGKRCRELNVFIFISLFYLAYSLWRPHNVTPAIWTDFLIEIKPYLAFYSVYALNFSISRQQREKICRFCKISAVCLLPIAILGFGGTGIMNDFGGHSRFATMLTILSLTYLLYSEQKKRDLYISLLILTEGLASTRSKIFGFYITFITIMFFWGKFKASKIVNIKNIIMASVLVVGIIYAAREKIEFYFVDGTQSENMFARPLLYMKAWEILQDYPILGTGFGSYATHASALYYSPLYNTYGLVYSPEIGNGLFISDTFFPVFAQFGFVGILLFIVFWKRRLKETIRNLACYNNKLYFKLILLIIIFFTIESIADSTFTHNRGMVMMMLMGIILNNRYDETAPTNKQQI